MGLESHVQSEINHWVRLCLTIAEGKGIRARTSSCSWPWRCGGIREVSLLSVGPAILSKSLEMGPDRGWDMQVQGLHLPASHGQMFQDPVMSDSYCCMPLPSGSASLRFSLWSGTVFWEPYCTSRLLVGAWRKACFYAGTSVLQRHLKGPQQSEQHLETEEPWEESALT